MGLSDNLISQFAKLTVGDKKTRSEATVFGTVKEYDGSKYVQLDGSELLTPVSSTTDIIDGDRVTVLIKDHTATITGNLTSPSARLEYVEGVDNKVEGVKKEIAEFDTVVAEMVVAEVGKFDTVIADKVDAIIVDAKLVTTDILEADYVTTQKLEAEIAKIGELDVDSLDAKYAQIDFANIGEAAIKKFFAESGIVKNWTSQDGYVTGELSAVTINADLINAGTLKADRLAIKGEDGLFYRLNISGVGEDELAYDENGDPILDADGKHITVEQTDENSLNGTKIQAQSITASKINVSDLVAFGATIGGFQIDDDSIHSHGKGSTYKEDENGDMISQYDGVHNTNPGIYMDDIGQVAFGDSNNYIKYYKDSNEEWKMAFKASEFTFDVSPGVSISEAIGNTIVLTEEEFYLSDSPTELSGGSWSNSQPTWTAGKYIWRRTKNTYNKKDENGNPVFDYTPSDTGVCITGNTGADGESPITLKLDPEVLVVPVSSSGLVKETLTLNIKHLAYKGESLDVVEGVEAAIYTALPSGWSKKFVSGGEAITIQKDWSVSSSNITSLTVRFAGPPDGRIIGTRTLPIVFLYDGETGPQGDPGESPINIYVSDYEKVDTCHISATGVVLSDTDIYIDALVLRKGNDGVKAYYMMSKSNNYDCFRPDWTMLSSWTDDGNNHFVLDRFTKGDPDDGAMIYFKIPQGYQVSEKDLKQGYILLNVCINDEEANISTAMYSYPFKIRLLSDPVSITSISEHYQTSEDNEIAPSDWSDDPLVPTKEKPYLWNYETITYSDHTANYPHQTITKKRVIGMYGEKGEDGDPGRGITSITNYYATTADTNEPDANDWKTEMQITSVDKPYLWTYERIEYTSGNPSTTNPIIIGTHGATGPEGPRGTAGVAYSMTANVYAIVRTASGKYIPENVILYGRQQSGTNSITPYAGKFKIEYTSDNINWKTDTYGYSSSSDESEKSYKVPDDIKALRCSFYTAGGFDTKLDEQIIPVVSDGLDGDGYTVILTNETHTFAATYDGAAVDGGTTTCKVFAYKGGSREEVTIGTISGKPTGMTTSLTSNGTVDAGFTVTVDSSVTTGGSLTIPIKVDGKDFEKQFTYTLALAGAKGDPGDATTSYSMLLSSHAIARSSSGTYTPSSIKLTGKAKTGDNPPVDHNAYFVVETTTATNITSSTTWTQRSISGSAQTSHTYTIGTNLTGITALRCSMYSSSTISTATLLDQQIVPIVYDGTNGKDGKDGEDGENGKDGESAYTVVLSNENHTFAGTTSAAVNSTIQCYIEVYEGATQIPSKITKISSTSVTGSGNTVMTLPGLWFTPYNNDGLSTSNYVTIQASPNSYNPLTTASGVITLTINAGNQTFTKDFSFSVAFQGEDGESSYTHVRYSTDGRTFCDATNKLAGTGNDWTIGTPSTDRYNGAIDSSNAFGVTYNDIIRVIPNEKYTIATNNSDIASIIYWYDNSGNFLETFMALDTANVTIPNSAAYARICIGMIYGIEITNATQLKNAITNGLVRPEFSQAKVWMGTFVSPDPTPSDEFSDYTWSKIMGNDGKDGEKGDPGDPGRNGQTLYGTCQTIESAQEKKVVLATGIIEESTPPIGTALSVKFSQPNTHKQPYLNVFGGEDYTGAYPIKVNTALITDTNPYYWETGAVISFIFDGDYWVATDVASTTMKLTDDGLVVGNWFGDELQNNVLIDASAVKIRGGKNGTDVYAEYGANTIYIGKNNTGSLIDLCDGSLQMQLTTYSNDTSFFIIKAPTGSAGMAGSGFVSLNATPYVDDGYSYADVTVNGQDSLFWAVTRKYNTITKNTYGTDIKACANEDNGYVLLSAAIPDHSVELKLDAKTDTVSITGASLSVSDVETTNGYFQNLDVKTALTMANGKAITTKNSVGNTVNMMYMGTDTYNILNVGGGANPPSRLYLGINGATLRFYASDNATSPYYFHPAENGKYACGTSTYPWYRFYATNTTIGTSDRRMKENIVLMGASSASTYSLRNSVDIYSELFDRLQPVQYNFIEGNSRTCYGLIAQDVIEAMGELGIGENDLDLVHHEYHVNPETGEDYDTYGIAYTNLIAILIHEVQKLKSRVDELENN